MTLLQLLLGLVILFCVLFIVEHFLRPPLSELEQALAAVTKDVQTFAVLLGTQLVPAFEQATVAVNDLNRLLVEIDSESE